MDEIKEKNKGFKIIDIIIAIFTTGATELSLNIVEIAGEEGIYLFLKKFIASLSIDYIKLFGIFIAMLFMICFRKKIESKKHYCIKNIFAILLSICMVMGYSYTEMGTYTLLFKDSVQTIKTCIVLVGYWMLFYNIIDVCLFYLVEKIEYKPSKSKVFSFIFEKHSFCIPLIIIIVCWIPYLVAFFPGCLMPDSSTQIEQFFGIEIDQSSVSNSVKLIDEGVKITNHHPVLHTVILGSCMKVGKLVGNDNIGVLLCTLIQIICLSAAFSYIINFMKKLKTNNLIRILSLIMFALFPIFPMCAIKITKDILFASLLIFYVIEIYKIILNSKNKVKLSLKNLCIVLFLCILLALIRNNGIYTVLLSLPFVAIIDKKNRIRIIALAVIIFAIYKLIVSALFPALKITPSSTSEMLSVPFQQTARYVKEYPKDVTDKEKETISKVLNYNKIAKKYNPEKSDSVKKQYNKDCTKQDIKDYLKIWIKMFKKHPSVYFDAFCNNYYGYMYPESEVQDLGTGYVNNADPILSKTGQFNYRYIKKFKTGRRVLKQLTNLSYKLPIIAWPINIALNNWLLIGILIYLVCKKKYKYIVYLLPGLSVLIVCFASPLNSCYRYSLPIIFMMPLILSIFINIVKTNDEKGVKHNEQNNKY
jgi:hypothetical protein